MFKKFLIKFAQCAGLNWAASHLLRKRVYVVGYHSVTSLQAPVSGEEFYTDLSIDSNLFEEQIKYLKDHGHTFLRFCDLIHLDTRIKKPTVVYFDDGFKDNLLSALPVLDGYKIHPTIFIVPGFIEGLHVPLTSYYRFLLKEEGRSIKEIKKAVVQFKQLTYLNRKKIVSELDTKERRECWQKKDIYLSWEDVRALSSRGVEIGSHTFSHIKVTECAEDELRSELYDSKRMIEQRINMPVVSFSYPHGRSNFDSIQALQEAGYKWAITSREGLSSLSYVKKTPLELKKIAPRVHENMEAFKFRLYGLQLLRIIFPFL